jgi:hypothetical protein
VPISKAPIAQQQRQYVKGVFSAGANPARGTNFMSQPIFAIKKSKVKEIVEHQSKFTQIPYHLE